MRVVQEPDRRPAAVRSGPPGLVPMLPLLLAALLSRVFFLLVGPFFVRPDEVFQALEPAHRLVTGRGAITWEWHEGIRSWLLPGLIAALMRLTAALGLGHSIVVVQCVFAALSLAVVATALRFGHAFAGRDGALFCGVLTAFWPDTMLLGPHTLSEVQGGNLLAIGTMLASVAPGRHGPLPRRALAIGLVLGFATVLRFQLLPGVAVVLLVAALRDGRRTGSILLLGAALPVLGQAVLDMLTLGTPLQSMWKNLAVNLVAHRADLFGTMSPVFYLSQMVQFWGAAVLPLALCFAAGARTAPLASLVVLAVVLSHSLIAHKEFSFIAGAVPLILAVAAVGAARLLQRLRPAVGVLPLRIPLASAVAAGMVLTCVTTTFSGYKALRRDHANLPLLMREARDVPGLCGLGLYVGDEGWWDWTGGYSLLDRPVPIYLLRSPADLAATAPGFDALLAAQATLGTLPAAYAVARCVRGACLLRRAGPCAPIASHRFEDATGLGLPIPPGSLRSPPAKGQGSGDRA